MSPAGSLNYIPYVPWLFGRAHNTYTQFGEDGLIHECLRQVGMRNRHCFEVGAADGRFFSNTLSLREQGWYAVLAEKDPVEFGKLAADFGTESSCLNEHVVNLDETLSRTAIDLRPDLGVIDVDGQDWHLWDQMKLYRPRVMLVEIFPTDTAEPVPELGARTGQAGLNAIADLGESKGYELVATTYCNALFVDIKERG